MTKLKSINKTAGAEMDERAKKVREECRLASLAVDRNNVTSFTNVRQEANRNLSQNESVGRSNNLKGPLSSSSEPLFTKAPSKPGNFKGPLSFSSKPPFTKALLKQGQNKKQMVRETRDFSTPLLVAQPKCTPCTSRYPTQNPP